MASTIAQQNNKMTGVRKKLQFRDTRLGVLPNTIDAFSRLTVDVATKAALTAAGARLTVEIDTAGTRVFLADQRTGQLIGGPEDLARLGGIRSFVNRERKVAQGVEVAREVTQLAYKASNMLSLNVPGYVQPPLEASYGAAVRPLLSIIDTVDDNMKKLSENTNPTLRDVFEPELKTLFTKIKNVYFRVILAHTRGENTKGELQRLLFDYGVPEYVHARLTNRSLVLDRAQELARVLFPSDPSKGLALTLKEWRDSAFRDKVGSALLGHSGLVVKLVNDSGFIRAITKIDSSIGLEDEANPSIAKLLKCRVGVLPPMDDSRYVIDPASKTKAGWKFPSPSMDSIPGAISALSTAVLRMYSANMQSVDLVGDYYATIVPGAVNKASVTPTNNFYVQWGNAKDYNVLWLDHIYGGRDGEQRQNVWRWLRTEMRLSEKGEGGKALATALILDESGKPLDKGIKVKVTVEKTDPSNPKNKILEEQEEEIYPPLSPPTQKERASSTYKVYDLQRDLTAAEIPLWQQFQRVTFPTKKKGKKVVSNQGNTLTRLTDSGKRLVGEIETISPALAERMRQWLRGFSDERVQHAAIKLANASFDELFIQDSIESEGESEGYPSDDEN